MATPFTKEIREYNLEVKKKREILATTFNSAAQSFTSPVPKLETDSLLWWIEAAIDKGNFNELKALANKNKIEASEWVALLQHPGFRTLIQKLMIQASLGMKRVNNNQGKFILSLAKQMGLIKNAKTSKRAEKKSIDKITFAPTGTSQ